MALDHTNSSEKKASAEAGMTQRRRWLVFGSNVVVGILLAIILTGAAIWLSGAFLKGKTRSDWTSGGRFSLSPRSKAMLSELPCDVRMTNLFIRTPERPGSLEEWQRVQDLLNEYANASSKVSMEAIDPDIDVAGMDKLYERLKTRYAKEIEKPKAHVEAFKALSTELDALLDAEAKRLDAAAKGWKGGPENAVMALRTVGQGWRELKGAGQQVSGAVQILTDQPLPAYGTSLSRAKEYLKIVNDNLGAVPAFYAQVQEALQGAAVPDDVKAILAGAKETYEPMRKKIADFQKAVAEVEELELDSVRRDIAQGDAVLIEAPERVKVVSAEEIWLRPAPADERSETAPEPRFNGESAISSALLGLCNKQRPAVLFVTFGGPATAMGNPMMGGRGGPYSGVADRLRKANFIVEDWDLMRGPEMPVIKDASKTVLVLVPPPPMNPQQPMPPPTPEAYNAVSDLIKGGTPAIILGEPGQMFAPAIPYAGLFDVFGVKPRFDAVAVMQVVVDAATGDQKAIPQVAITSYPKDNPISTPLDGLPTMMFRASPLIVSKTLPEGVIVTSIIDMPGGPDSWAETTMADVGRGEAKRNPGVDLDGPLPLGVAVTRKLKEGEQKVVLFGNAAMAMDGIAFYRDPRDPFREAFPGNAELFVNSVLWVSGTQHLITVSPESLQARRIGDLGNWGLAVQIFLVVGLPILVLAAGVVVFVIRRR